MAWVPSLYLTEGITLYSDHRCLVVMYKKTRAFCRNARYWSLYQFTVFNLGWSNDLESNHWSWSATQSGNGFSACNFILASVFFLRSWTDGSGKTISFWWLWPSWMGAFCVTTNVSHLMGCHLIALKAEQQSFLSDLRVTFYRIGMITGNEASRLYCRISRDHFG